MSTINFNHPDTTQNYSTQFVPGIEQAIQSLGFMLDSTYVTSYTNLQTGMKRLRAGEFESYNGSAWVKYALSYLDNTAPVTYGSVSIAGSTSGYSGIQFSTPAAKYTIMVRDSDGLFGLRDVTGAVWKWYFDAAGQLGGGATVPYSNVTGTPDLSIYAPKNNPAFTGTPTAPTAAVGTNTGQIANTAYVLNNAASATPLMDGVAAVGTSTRHARGDHRHPSDSSKADLAGAALTGTVTINGLEIGTKRVPVSSSIGSSYTFTAADVAKTKPITAGQLQIPSGVFAAGDVMFGYNASSNTLSLVPLSGVTCYLSGVGATGNRTIGPRGLVMIYCVASNVFLVSGPGVA